jgi:lipoprotein-releasing system permease protein
VPSRFELFVAARYLMAKRKQTVISFITLLSVAGVAAGVMALVIALAINTGMRNTMERNLLGATAHVILLEKVPGEGIVNWRELMPKLKPVPGVRSVQPTLYGQVFLPGGQQTTGAVLKGIPGPGESEPPAALKKLREGSFEGWQEFNGLPPVLVGVQLARQAGLKVGSVVRVISPQGEMTPYGPRFTEHRLRVKGIFESGFYELDTSWAFASLGEVQKVLAVGDVVNAMEMNVDDVYSASDIARAVERAAGPKYGAQSWMEQNRQLLNALRLEKTVTVITISLILMVAMLNIIISLVMMVMEKHRDVAVLMTLGARAGQIARIFRWQGLLIGLAGTVIGLTLGYGISFLAGHYRWIQMDESIYSMSFVPFEARALDGLWIAGATMLVSFLATILPARNASKIEPVEALRYE